MFRFCFHDWNACSSGFAGNSGHKMKRNVNAQTMEIRVEKPPPPPLQQQQLQQPRSADQQARNQRLQQPFSSEDQQQQTQPALPKPSAASGSSSGHSGAVIVDHREDVWPKLQVLQGKYLQGMHDLSGLVRKMGTVAKSEEQLKNVRGYEEVLHRIVSYLIVTKERLPPGFDQVRLEALENNILSVVEIFKRLKTSK